MLTNFKVISALALILSKTLGIIYKRKFKTTFIGLRPFGKIFKVVDFEAANKGGNGPYVWQVFAINTDY